MGTLLFSICLVLAILSGSATAWALFAVATVVIIKLERTYNELMYWVAQNEEKEKEIKRLIERPFNTI